MTGGTLALDAEVVIAPRRGRNAADDEIVRLLGETDDPAEWTVVTSDRRLTGRVRATAPALA